MGRFVKGGVWRETRICLDLRQDAEEQAFKPFVIALTKGNVIK